MKTKVKFACFMCGFMFIDVQSADLPSFITPCSISLPPDQFNDCVTYQARIAQPMFANGLPEYGVEPLDPLRLNNIEAKAGTFSIKSSNILLQGLGTVDIVKLTLNTQKMTGTTRIFGNMTITCDYEILGNIFLLPVNSKGQLTVKMYDTEIFMKYKVRTYKDSYGVEHAEGYDYKPSQKYGNIKLHMSDLLGDATLGETINQVMNENWRDIMKEVGPPYIAEVNNKVQEILNNFYKVIPYEKMTLP